MAVGTVVGNGEGEIVGPGVRVIVGVGITVTTIGAEGVASPLPSNSQE